MLVTQERRPLEFLDRTTGLRFLAQAPADDPAAWAAYIEGLRRGYETFGVEWIVDVPALASGDDTTLFFVAVDHDGAVVAGTRCHGPLRDAQEAYALRELAGHPRLDLVRRAINRRIPEGAIEVKGGWVAPDVAGRRALADTVARCAVHAMAIFGVKSAFGTMADHAARMWRGSGACPADYLDPVSYPDSRYCTVLVWWNRDELSRTARPDQLALLREEGEELAASLAARRGAKAALAPSPPYRAAILDPSQAEDAAAIARYRSDPGVTVYDEVGRQRAELAKLLPRQPKEVVGEPARWAYYPWRNSLVSVLGPAGYGLLRLDRNRNKITGAEQSALRRLRIGIVGLSVGHAIAHTLAMEGCCAELRLADFDELELSNLNRVPATVFDLGVNKAVVAARRIAELDPYVELALFPGGLQAANAAQFLDGLDLVIEECDSLDMKVLVREEARRRGIPLIMETSDRGLLDVERFDLERDRPLFHGLLGEVDSGRLASLSVREKVPHVLRILGPADLSAATAASMAEVDRTLGSWPQLAGDITLGAASVAAAVVRWATGRPLPSGRVRVDLDRQLDGLAEPPAPYRVPAGPGAATRRPDEPRAAADGEAVRGAAVLAPSGGNVQPWLLELDGGGLSVRVDPARTSRMDMHYRGSYVAAGAALWNARCEAAWRGILGPVTVLPDPGDPFFAGRLDFADTIDLTLAELREAMYERCANRNEGEPAALADTAADALRHAAAAEGAAIRLITAVPFLRELAYVFGEADRLRYLDPVLHAEMVSELRWPGRDLLDTGIDVRTLGLDDTDMAKLELAARGDVMERLAAWRAGVALGDPSRDRIRSGTALAVVTVPGTAPADYVRGGAAVERVWVAGQKAGLAIYPMSPPFLYCTGRDDYAAMVGAARAGELEELSEEFRELAGIASGEGVVLALRLSVAPPPRFRSLRRAGGGAQA